MPGISLRADWDAERVRRAARLATDAGQVRRLLSIAAIYDGMSRAAAARLGAMDRQTLHDWVHRFNAAGANTEPPSNCWTPLLRSVKGAGR